MDERLTGLETLARLLGLKPIAGGVGEKGSNEDNTADDTSSGDTSDDDVDTGGETQETEDTEAADKDTEELSESEDVEVSETPIRSRAAERIRELNERSRRAEMDAEFWRNKANATGDRNDGKARELPKELQEVDAALKPYMSHVLTPIEQQLVAARLWMEWVSDRMEFYADYPQYAGKKHRGVIEETTQALSQRLGRPIKREDVLMYLRGNPKYAKQFAAEPEPKQRIVEEEVAARRSAGRVNAKPPKMPSRQSAEPPDLSKMSPAERVKHFESVLADQAF